VSIGCHRDTQVSIGCDAVFLIGGTTKHVEPLPIIVRLASVRTGFVFTYHKSLHADRSK
jgi:hypothetical protein